MEWTPSAGATIRFPDVEVRYSGWFTTGTGRPSVHFAVRPGTARGRARCGRSPSLPCVSSSSGAPARLLVEFLRARAEDREGAI